MVNWAYQPPEDQTDQILQNYERGQQVGQARDRRSAMSAYLPQALGGGPDAKEAVVKIAAADPEFGVRLSTFYQAQEETARKKSLENWDFIGTILQRPDGSPIQSPEEIQHAKTLAIVRGLPADQVNQVTPESIPQLIQTSQSARQYARQAQQDELSRRQAESSIRANDAQTQAARTRAAMVSGGINPETGQPVMKLTEVQSKDLAFYQRGQSALNKLDNDRINHMISGRNAMAGSLPFGYGNAMIDKSARQGKQAAADFLAAILRKDSGAALTQSDFDIYGQIFIPQWGDDPGTLEQKASSRKQALESLRAGLGTAQILAQFGPQPQDPNAKAPTMFKYDANGNRVQ